MEASQAGLKEGFTLYAFGGEGTPDPTAWPEAPLRTEAGEQLYYFSGDTVAGEAKGTAEPNWTVYTGATQPPTPGASDAAPADAAPADASATTDAQPGATEPADATATAGAPEDAHAPAATAQEQVIVGDAGLGESQPASPATSQDTPLVNATPPQAQSGVALPEDRAAGVQPDPSMAGTVAPPAPEVAPQATPPAQEETPAAAAPAEGAQSPSADELEAKALEEEQQATKDAEAAEAARKAEEGGAQSS